MAFTGIFIYTLTGLKALSVNLGLPTTQHILPASWVMSLILSGCIFSGIKISIDPGFFTTQDFAHPAPINAFYWDLQRSPPPFCSKSSFYEQSVEMEKNWAKKMQSPQTSQCPCFGQRSHGCKQRLSSDIHNFRSVGIIKRRGELWRHKMIFSEFSPNVKKKCWHFSCQFSYSVNKQIPPEVTREPSGLPPYNSFPIHPIHPVHPVHQIHPAHRVYSMWENLLTFRHI